MIKEKQCPCCKETKEASAFCVNNARKDKLAWACRHCSYHRIRKGNYKKRPETYLRKLEYDRKGYEKKGSIKGRKSYLKKNYGITPEQYQEMFEIQKGYCYLCGIHQSMFSRRLSLDHCHKTKKLRKLLCRSCNCGLGFLKHDTDLLDKAIKYLKGEL